MSTIDGLNSILSEQFGPERAAALDVNAKPWYEAIGAKQIDLIDFRLFVEEQFGVYLPTLMGDTSLQDVADYIDATTARPFPH